MLTAVQHYRAAGKDVFPLAGLKKPIVLLAVLMPEVVTEHSCMNERTLSNITKNSVEKC